MSKLVPRTEAHAERPLPPLSLNARFRWDVISSVVGQRRPTSVLEIGAGRGAVGARLARDARYVGVEPDEQSRGAAALALAGRAGVVVEDMDAVDDEQRFDMIGAFEVLEHIDDDVGALREWASRLAPDGFVLLSVPAHRSRFGASDVRVGHFRRYDRADVLSLVAGAGLCLDGLWSTGWPAGHVLETAWNVAARLRPGRGSAADRSSESGRWFQPSHAVAPLWGLVSMPGLWLHRKRFDSDDGTGWVILCGQP